MHHYFSPSGVRQNCFLYHRFLKPLSTSALSASLCLSLGGCSTTSETFDCKAGKGVGCKSISEINQMVDQGILGREVEKGKQSILPLSAPIISADSPGIEIPNIETLPKQTEIPLSDAMAVHRIQEEHLRVWVAPFQDEQGNLHEGSVIHTVLKPGYWQLRTSPQRVNDPRVSDSTSSEPTSLDVEEVD